MIIYIVLAPKWHTPPLSEHLPSSRPRLRARVLLSSPLRAGGGGTHSSVRVGLDSARKPRFHGKGIALGRLRPCPLLAEIDRCLAKWGRNLRPTARGLGRYVGPVSREDKLCVLKSPDSPSWSDGQRGTLPRSGVGGRLRRAGWLPSSWHLALEETRRWAAQRGPRRLPLGLTVLVTSADGFIADLHPNRRQAVRAERTELRYV